MAQALPGEVAAQLLVVRHVAVVGHSDAERVIDRERLGVLAAAGTHRRVPHVPDAEMALESIEVGRREDIADQALALLDVKTAVVGHDPGRVLAAVLHRDEPVVDFLHRRRGTGDTDEATHCGTRIL